MIYRFSRLTWRSWMSAIVLRMSHGRPATTLQSQSPREALLAVVPPALLGAAVLVLGLYVPPGLGQMVAGAAAGLGGAP